LSTSTTLPLWGQAWELQAVYADESGNNQTQILSSTDYSEEPLRIVFEVQKIFADSPFWYADISIYNLDNEQILNTFLNATWVTLKAGFQNGPQRYSTIWDSGVFQVLYDRENVVDQKITFHCVANPANLAQPVAIAVGPFSSQNDIVARMTQALGLPPVSPAQATQSQNAFDLMAAKKYPRGSGVFGSANHHLNMIAGDNHLFKWHDGRNMYMSDFFNDDWTPDLYYAPVQPYTGVDVQSTLPEGVTASIIGSPQQTPFGIEFTVLLDPRLDISIPPMVVELDKSVFFRQTSMTPAEDAGLLSKFDPDLKFLVGRVRHRGDSRGNDWCTDVTAFTNTYAKFISLGRFTPS
jgi:hypothetical protein